MTGLPSTPKKDDEAKSILDPFFKTPATPKLHRYPKRGPSPLKNKLKIDLETLKEASIVVQDEMEALEVMNTRQAVIEVAKMFDIGPKDLWVYYKYGEEEAKRVWKVESDTKTPQWLNIDSKKEPEEW
jgi:hypothetical protein